MTAQSKAINKERSTVILNYLKYFGGDVYIFVDKKKFGVDKVFNRRKSRIVAKESSCTPSLFQSEHTAYVMVFGVDAITDASFPSFYWIVPEDQYAEYIKILEEVLSSLVMKNYYDPMKVMLIYDSASAHC